MELWPWRCNNCQRINKKQAIKCALCYAHWTSGTRHNTQPKQQPQHQENAGWQDWGKWSREWDEWEQTDASHHWDRSRSQSQASTRSAKSDAYKNQKSHKGNKGQHKGKGKGGKSKAKDSANASKQQSPFAPLATELPPWPALESTTVNLMPSVASTSSPFHPLLQQFRPTNPLHKKGKL